MPLGRPAKYWRLTRDANRLFPDAYAELSVALIDAVGDTFGAAGMDRLLQARLARQKSDYAARIDRSAPLGKKSQSCGRPHGSGGRSPNQSLRRWFPREPRTGQILPSRVIVALQLDAGREFDPFGQLDGVLDEYVLPVQRATRRPEMNRQGKHGRGNLVAGMPVPAAEQHSMRPIRLSVLELDVERIDVTLETRPVFAFLAVEYTCKRKSAPDSNRCVQRISTFMPDASIGPTSARWSPLSR